MIRDTKYFRFGPARQERGSKHLRGGDLLEAVNVRQTDKGGVYAKRKGFSRTTQTFSGGSLIGVPVEVYPGVNGTTLMRDSGDQLWARAAGSNQWVLKGTHHRVWPETEVVQSNGYTAPQPFSVLVGTNVWTFALRSGAYDYSIYEATTGVQILGRTAVTAANIAHASAAYDGTYVWLFYVENQANGRVLCHKLDPASPTSAPVATTYYTMPAAPTNISATKLQQVQARYFSAAAQVFVVVCGADLTGGTYRRACAHSVLDPATGLAVVAGGQAAVASVAYNGADGSAHVGALYILDGQDGSAASWYYTVAGTIDATTTEDKVVIVSVNAANFATNPKTVLVNEPIGTGFARCSAGFSDGGIQYIFTTTLYAGVSPYGASAGNVYRSVFYVRNGATVTASASSFSEHYGAWIASGFAKVGSRWYALTGYDDYSFCGAPSFSSEDLSTQRCLHVREFTAGASATASAFSIVAQFDVGEGPALHHRARAALAIPAAARDVTCVPPAHVVGTEFLVAVGKKVIAPNVIDIALCTVETAKVWGKGAQAMGRAFAPGGVPVVWNGNDMHETSPLLNPPCVFRGTVGAGATYNIFAACYAIYDSDGVVWRSAPFILSAAIQALDTFSVYTPRIFVNGAKLYVEMYIGAGGVAKLQSIVRAEGALSVGLTAPLTADFINGEILYTTGNALSQAWPAPCQCIGTWRNRVLMAQRNRVLVSKELEAGFGPLFNEVQASLWSDVDSDINAMAPVDQNYLALLADSGAAVMSGAGPDGVGNGNYSIQALQTRKGVVAGGVAGQGPAGCHFHDSQTARLCAITPSLSVVEVAGGAYDYSAYVVTAIAWHEAENLLMFVAGASNAAIVIDYNHPDEGAPAGQVYLWTFAAAFGPTVACRDASGVLVLNSGGHVYRQASAAWVDDKAGGTDTYRMKLTTGELQIADLQGGFSLEKLAVLLAMRGVSGVTVETFAGYSTTAAHAVALDLPAPSAPGLPEHFWTRPGGCYRVPSVRVSLTEKAGVTSQSFEFEGLGLEITALGRLLRPAETRVI